MAIGERIRFIRNLRGMTQKYLGTLVGFPEKTADVRMAQYEAGTRTPKEDLTKALAAALDVSPLALNVPDIGRCAQCPSPPSGKSGALPGGRVIRRLRAERSPLARHPPVAMRAPPLCRR